MEFSSTGTKNTKILIADENAEFRADPLRHLRRDDGHSVYSPSSLQNGRLSRARQHLRNGGNGGIFGTQHIHRRIRKPCG